MLPNVNSVNKYKFYISIINVKDICNKELVNSLNKTGLLVTWFPFLFH